MFIVTAASLSVLNSQATLIRAMLKAGKREEAKEVMYLVLSGAPKSTFNDILKLFTDTSTDHHWFVDAVRNIVKSKCSPEHLLDIAAFISWDIVGLYLPGITRLDIKDIDRNDQGITGKAPLCNIAQDLVATECCCTITYDNFLW